MANELWKPVKGYEGFMKFQVMDVYEALNV